MQIVQISAAVAVILFPLLGALNVYLLNQVRLELAALKIQMLEARTADAKELRAWVEAEFLRKAEAQAKFDKLLRRPAH